ncbi:hypothetical protein F4X73_18100 [Candidatus Poribacteria bacterium]|nr:hypothetical protein [Candidatus Poribacteria bacterium]
MPKCKISEAHVIDYVIGELDHTEAAEFRYHLTTCNHCIRHVNVLKHVLQLVDSAEAEIAPQAIVPTNLESKLYRRLAEEPIQKPSVHSRFTDFIARLGLILQIQKPAVVGLLAVVAIAITLLIGNPFDNETTESVDARIEQYHHQGIQRSMEDVIRNKHLRPSDEWNTVSQLNRVKDQAKGTDWAVLANEHLKGVNSKL